MPIEIVKSSKSELPKEELIPDALQLVLAPTSADLPSGPTTTSARQEIESICNCYKARLELPSIGEARQALKDMADATESLAELYRHNVRMLVAGAPTHNPKDTADQDSEKEQEIRSAQEQLLSEAAQLDQIAKRLHERCTPWVQNTGPISTAKFVYGDPAIPFATTAAHLFNIHRPDDLHAGQKGDFYMLLRLLHEIATGVLPKTTELLPACRIAVKAVRGEQ